MSLVSCLFYLGFLHPHFRKRMTEFYCFFFFLMSLLNFVIKVMLALKNKLESNHFVANKFLNLCEVKQFLGKKLMLLNWHNHHYKNFSLPFKHTTFWILHKLEISFHFISSLRFRNVFVETASRVWSMSNVMWHLLPIYLFKTRQRLEVDVYNVFILCIHNLTCIFFFSFGLLLMSKITITDWCVSPPFHG